MMLVLKEQQSELVASGARVVSALRALGPRMLQDGIAGTWWPQEESLQGTCLVPGPE